MEDEKNILSCLIKDNDLLCDLVINDDYFTTDLTITVFKTIKKLYQDDIKADILTISENSTVSFVDVSAIFDLGVSSCNYKYYEDRVIQAWKERKVKSLVLRLKDEKNPDYAVEYMQQFLIDFQKSSTGSEIFTLKEMFQPHIRQMEQEKNEFRKTGKFAGIETGYQKLDSLLCNLQKGEMAIIAARPSEGKSALMLNMALNMKHNNVKVGIINYDDSNRACINRLMAMRSGIPTSVLRVGNHTKEQQEKLHDMSIDLYTDNIIMSEPNTTSLQTCISIAKLMKAKHEIDILFIDYLQLLHAGKENKIADVGESSQSIKTLARQLDIPIVSLAQLNRDAENKKPTLRNLSDSSQIEKDANVVIFIHHKKGLDEVGEIDDNLCNAEYTNIIIGKSKNGSKGTIKFEYKAPILRFEQV